MNRIESYTIEVLGASIYYEVCGKGPLLLIVSGGCGDANANQKLVDQLTDEFTIVTYDRRGYSRSQTDGPVSELSMETVSEDVSCLLKVVGSQPVYVLGSSIGGVIALDLVARHPEQVHTVIAHEPPAHSISAPPEAKGTLLSESIQDILQKEGAGTAMKSFTARVGIPNTNAGMVLNAENAKFFIQYEAPMLGRYQFDFEALKRAMAHTKILIGRGVTSPKDSIGYLGATAIAEHLNQQIVEFPGNHAGMNIESKKFAARVCELLIGRK